MIPPRLIQSLLVCFPLMLHAQAGQACRAPRIDQLIGVGEQIRLANNVAVGQVISATPIGGQEVEYRFLALEQLAGQTGPAFTVTGRAVQRGDEDTTFNDHAAFSFWARGGGRVMNDADCVIRPGFVVGGTYLVFLGRPVTRRSFEEIDMVNGIVNAGDRWLMYVRQQLAAGQVPDRPAAAGAQEHTRDYERIGRFIYRFHRVVARDDLDRKTLAARQAPAELLQRAGNLADEFDHIVASDTIPDAEVDATLAEAVAVKKILATWLANGGGSSSPVR